MCHVHGRVRTRVCFWVKKHSTLSKGVILVHALSCIHNAIFFFKIDSFITFLLSIGTITCIICLSTPPTYPSILFESLQTNKLFHLAEFLLCHFTSKNCACFMKDCEVSYRQNYANYISNKSLWHLECNLLKKKIKKSVMCMGECAQECAFE